MGALKAAETAKWCNQTYSKKTAIDRKGCTIDSLSLNGLKWGVLMCIKHCRYYICLNSQQAELPLFSWGRGLFRMRILGPQKDKKMTFLKWLNVYIYSLSQYAGNLISPWTCSTKDPASNHFWVVGDDTVIFLGDRLLWKSIKYSFAFLEFYQNFNCRL